MLKIVNITISLFFTIILFAMISNPTLAQGSDEIKLFVQEDCQYCEEVLDFIAENDLDTQFQIDIYEINSSEDNAALFDEYATKCDINANYVPMIYINGKCTTNSISVIDALQRFAGLTDDTSEEIPVVDDAENTSTVSEDIEDSTLSEVLDTTPSPPDIPWYAYPMILAVFVSVGAIAYLLIKKMNV